MKVALIGDIHANLPALEAVLAQIENRSVDGIWNVGDWVGYGAFPDEVVKRLWDHEVVSIRGNYDTKVLKFPKEKKKWRKKKIPQKWLAFKWAYEQLSPEARGYLAGLPKEIRLQVAGKRVLITHGSPETTKEHVTPETSAVRFRELAEMSNADLVIFGHSHVPFARQAEGVWFINPGSVGRPDDGDPRASYAILEFTPTGPEVSHYRLAYDLQRTVAAIRENGLPEAFAQMMVQGRNLDDILAKGNSREFAER
jgi:putative phosphoesterase